MPGFNLYTNADILKQMRWWNLLVNKVAHRFPFAEVPPTFKMEDMKAFIKSDEDVERFGQMLGRFNKSEAQTIDPTSGRLKFLDAELQRAVDEVTAMRNDARANAYPEWEMMGMMDKIKAMTAGNIAPVTGNYTRPEDLTELFKWQKTEQIEAYLENYLAVLVDNMESIYDEVESKIYDIMELGGPKYLKAIFDRGYPETQIEYIYPSRTSIYKNEPFDERLANVRTFWRDQVAIARENFASGKTIDYGEQPHEYYHGKTKKVSIRDVVTWV